MAEFRRARVAHEETLSGDARSVLILNCSPSRSCVADTLSTLRLGVCTSQVPCASVGGGAHVSEDLGAPRAGEGGVR